MGLERIGRDVAIMRGRMGLRRPSMAFRYTAGDSLAALGATFTNPSTNGVPSYIDANGIVQFVNANTARDSHYIGGVRTLLTEGQRANGFTKSSDFSDAAWTKQGSTVTASATTGPDSVALSAQKIVEDASVGASHGVRRIGLPTMTNATTQATTVFAKAAGRGFVEIATVDKAGVVGQSWVNLTTGAVGTKAAGHTIRVTTLGASWFRIETLFASGTGASTPEVAFYAAPADGTHSYNGDGSSGLYLWGAQFEADAAFASSYIPTTAAAVTRNPDNLWFPWLPVPQALTLFAKFIDLGTMQGLATGPGIFCINNTAGANPALQLYNSSVAGRVSLYHSNAVPTNVTSSVTTTINIGDLVEARGSAFPNGSVQAGVAVNGGVESTGAPSGALALANAYSGQRLYVNSQGTGAVGFAAFQSLNVAFGVRTLAEMRTA